MSQHGFFFDQSRCIGCNTCVVACKQWHDLSPGPIKWMRVYQWEEGIFPDLRLHLLAVPCYHCIIPVCSKRCPNGAIYKEERYGAVLVDPAKCQGTRKCWRACPYGAPQYGDDEPGAKMSKCNMCVDRLEQGLKPICVLSCPMRALEFGPLNALRARYGNLRRLEAMPMDSITQPAVVFRPYDERKQVIRWNSKKVLELWKTRRRDDAERLPDVFEKTEEVTKASQSIVGRHKLVLKGKNQSERMYYTTDDE